MKTCNNCGTVNELAKEKCMGCNMPGNFTVHSEYVEPELGEVKKISCTNCGSFHPGEGTHCVHCRFPLMNNKMKPITKQTVHIFRKVG